MRAIRKAYCCQVITKRIIRRSVEKYTLLTEHYTEHASKIGYVGIYLCG
jgi:hypothetical protein